MTDIYVLQTYEGTFYTSTVCIGKATKTEEAALDWIARKPLYRDYQVVEVVDAQED